MTILLASGQYCVNFDDDDDDDDDNLYGSIWVVPVVAGRCLPLPPTLFPKASCVLSLPWGRGPHFLHHSHQAMGNQKSQRRKMHTQDLEPAKLTPSPRVILQYGIIWVCFKN